MIDIEASTSDIKFIEDGSPATSGLNLADWTTAPARPMTQVGSTWPSSVVSTSLEGARELAGKSSADSMPAAIVANWGRLGSSNISNGLFEKLIRLANRPDGWRGPGSRGLTPVALGAFVEFWSKVRNRAAEPNVALTASGGLQAQWYRSPREHVDLHFRSSNQVFFGLFRRGGVNEGVDTVEHLVAALTAYSDQPLTWTD